MSVDEATPFYAQYEVVTPYGTVAAASLKEASSLAKEAAATLGKTIKVQKVATPYLVVSGWSPAEPVQEAEVVKPECCTSGKGLAVPHDNCLYGGRKMGHSPSHCTADACF
jgi:hypothetical protein